VVALKMTTLIRVEESSVPAPFAYLKGSLPSEFAGLLNAPIRRDSLLLGEKVSACRRISPRRDFLFKFRNNQCFSLGETRPPRVHLSPPLKRRPLFYSPFRLSKECISL